MNLRHLVVIVAMAGLGVMALPRAGQARSLDYAWEYGGRSFHATWNATDYESCEERYGKVSRSSTAYQSYILKDPCADSVRLFAQMLWSLGSRAGYRGAKLAQFAQNFVNTIPYLSDGYAPRYSYETLIDQHGNCADHSILLAAILSQWCMDVVLLDMTVNRPKDYHLAVGLSDDDLTRKYGDLAFTIDGRTYLYCEATPCGSEPCYQDIGKCNFSERECTGYSNVPRLCGRTPTEMAAIRRETPKPSEPPEHGGWP